MDLHAHEGGGVMLASQYEQSLKQKHFFLLSNSVFDLELNVYELGTHAYLIRVEDRRTYQCVVSFPTIADKLGISVNTVAKYVRTLEERGLIRTERTDIMTRDGRKRNGCLRYTIPPIRQAVDRFHQQKLEELSRLTARQNAKAKAEKLGVQFIPADSEQTA